MDTFQSFWHYHSHTAKERSAPPVPSTPPAGLVPHGLDTDTTAFFEISLDTVTLRPNHRMSLRTDIDGWDRDIHGTYWFGAWRFALPTRDYPNGCIYRFRLDGEWQVGEQQINAPANTHLPDGAVTFPTPAPRFQHGYENLRVRDDEQQQNLIRSMFSEKETWDVIIIGSGMGGGVLADALTDHPTREVKVLVLDAGGLDYPTHVDNLPVVGLGGVIAGHQVRHYENIDNNQRFGEFVQMNLGGRSVFWSGLIPRMRPWELEHWPASIRHYLLNSGYEAAEKLMRKHVAAGKFQEETIAKLQVRFPSFTVVNTPRSCDQPEFGPKENPDRHPESFLYRSTGTFSAAELLLDSMSAGKNPGRGRLAINLNHLVTELRHKKETVTGKYKVTDVVCQDLVANHTRTYKARCVVLAAGSLESPKIALNSKIVDKSRLIGQGLTDHPSFYAPDGYAGGETFYLKSTSPYAGPYKHARIFFYPDNPWRGHWFNVEIVINGQFWRSRHSDDDVRDAEHPHDARTTINFKFVFGSPLDKNNYVKLGARAEDRVKVKHGANPIGAEAHPAVLELLQQLLEFFEAEPVNWNNPGNCNFGNGGTVNHAGGTMRMGPPGSERVVDENLKFEEYDNLYVCDPSVWPYIPAANPSLTLVALSLRLADHLANKNFS